MKQCKHPTCGDTCRRPPKPKQRTRIKVKPGYRINKRSKKRIAENKIYHPEREKFLNDNPVCQIKSDECTYHATCIHHTRGRGKYFLDVSTWMASCVRCNDVVEERSQWAKENNFKISKYRKDE